MDECFSCGNKGPKPPLRSVRRDEERHAAGISFRMRVATGVCGACGHEWFDAGEEERFTVAIHGWLVASGLGGGEVVQYLRARSGLTSTALAALLGVRRETV